MDKEILSVSETAALLGISRFSVYRLIKGRSFPAVKIGRGFRFHRQTVIDWIAAGAASFSLEQVLKNKHIRFPNK